MTAYGRHKSEVAVSPLNFRSWREHDLVEREGLIRLRLSWKDRRRQRGLSTSGASSNGALRTLQLRVLEQVETGSVGPAAIDMAEGAARNFAINPARFP